MTTLTEAFGNARTASNANSTRHGSVLQVEFNRKGKLVGAHQTLCVLDKERVNGLHRANESSFHIFYYMLEGLSMEERTRLKLVNDVSHYACLTATVSNQKGFAGVGSEMTGNNLTRFEACLKACEVFGINARAQTHMFQLLSAILHIGNIQFEENQDKKQESCKVRNPEVVQLVAELLNLLPEAVSFFLTNKTKQIGSEQCTVLLNAAQACEQRDGLASNLYGALVNWLNKHMNERCERKQSKRHHGEENAQVGKSNKEGLSIRFVDFGGFQQQSSNRFYEFLVNFSNEQLQSMVMQECFERRLQYYRETNVVYPTLHLPNRRPLMDLLDKPETGLLALIHSETRKFLSGQGSNDALVERFVRHQGTSESYVVTKIASSAFGIQHYHGVVVYDHQHFLESNINRINGDLTSLIRGSEDTRATTNAFLYSIFTEYVGGAVLSSRASTTSSPIIKTDTSLKKKRTKTSEKESLALPDMVTNLSETAQHIKTIHELAKHSDTWFVHCLKCTDLKPDTFDANTVKAQIKEMNLLDLAKLGRPKYSVTFMIPDFLKHIAPILSSLAISSDADHKDCIHKLGQALGWSKSELCLGENRIYVEWNAFKIIEEKITKLKSAEMYEDSQSVFSDALTESDAGSEASDVSFRLSENDLRMLPGANQLKEKQLVAAEQAPTENIRQKTRSRRQWECCTWFLTWWIPSFCISACGMQRKDIQMAWREKVALNLLIFVLSIVVIFFIGVFGLIICPKEDVLTLGELEGKLSWKFVYVYTNGEIFDVTKFGKVHETSFGVKNETFIARMGGRDVQPLLEVKPSYCAFGDPEKQDILDKFQFRTWNITEKYGLTFPTHERPISARQQMKKYKYADVVWSAQYLKEKINEKGKGFYRIVGEEVFDLTDLLGSGNFTSEVQKALFPSNLGASFVVSRSELDWTPFFNKYLSSSDRQQALECMRQLFKVGRVDTRSSFRCQLANYALLVTTCVLVSIILIKFFAALQLGAKATPEEQDRFVICQVPCYTEDEESLRRTINSLASLRYDDKRKLLFIICDGMIVGSGNDRPTPRIVLDILGVDPSIDPEPLSYVALGEGMKQHNMGKVYSGLYEITGHVVPFIVVSKVGRPSERSRPGNRGKRDSQIVLMRFLNKVHYDKPMNPLELEMYHQIKNVIGVNPSFYEYILMVDADTIVMKDALNRLISVCVRDASIMGLCGETKIANEKESWATMIQVYEYFISHHMAKAFESLFGTVTCLPGCFCMYRVRAPNKSTPLLINNLVLEDYSQNTVETLHDKNLLHLGEDRYLTTLMLKHFPKYKMVFTADAQCETNVPDQWKVLVSQRRRWINSTVHNLFELIRLDQLCGFCCFSMRFVVMLDLFATLVMPATLIYLGYVLYQIATSAENTLPLVTIGLLIGGYALQVIIFTLKGKYEHIGWLVIYILAIPVFSFYLPLYSFWHFDDFSWGNTRVVLGENNKHVFLPAENETFDASSIPHKKWSEYEQEMWALEDKASPLSGDSSVSGLSRSSMLSRTTQDFYSEATNARNLNRHVYNANNPNSLEDQPLSMLAPQAPVMPYLHPQPLTLHAVNVQNVPHIVTVAQTPAPAYEPVLSASSARQRRSQKSPTKGTNLPSEADLLSEIQRILTGADLQAITKKTIRKELSAFFSVDMEPHKKYINELVDRCLADLNK
jgi:chitin synthase